MGQIYGAEAHTIYTTHLIHKIVHCKLLFKIILKADIKNLNGQIDNLKSEKKKLEDKVGDWMEDDNNAREELLAQINEKHNKLALKTIKVEEDLR